ncbi:MAG: tRNA pseudouridine(13) synthase TruD, partial [Candidatus Thermoplasmatota archaeon]
IGELIGNNFDVTIRDLDNPAIAEDRMIEITNEIMASNGFPNFFGIQRFGAVRPITHIVGRELINGNFEKAVFTYIGNPMKNERKEAYDARKFLEETHDFSKALELYPKELYFERRIIAHLAKEPKDYANALRRLPQNLTMMFIHAYQSYLFNKILSKRIEEGIQLNKAYIGDTILPIDKYGLPNQDEIINVEKENIGKVNKKITEGKAFLSAPLFGSETKISSGIGGEIEREVIEEEGVKNEDFIISSMPEVSSKGTRRELVGIIRELDWKLVDGNLKIKFGIQRGAYATSLLREYMKTGVLSY